MSDKSDVKQVVSHLQTLAREREYRSHILQDTTCLQGLVRFIENEDPEVVLGALMVFQLLLEVDQVKDSEERKKILAAQAGLSDALKRVMIHSNTAQAKQLATKVYASLQPFFHSNQQTQSSHTNMSQVPPLKDITNRNSAPSQPASAAGVSFFSGSVQRQFCRTKTFEVSLPSSLSCNVDSPAAATGTSIASQNSNILTTSSSATSAQHTQPGNKIQEIEQELVRIKGIVSFTIDVKGKKATIRYMNQRAQLLAALKQCGFHDALILHGDDDDTALDGNSENEGYLPEPVKGKSSNHSAAASSSWFSSIVSWGAPTVDERKRKHSKASSTPSTGWMSTLVSVGEKLNIL